MDKDRFVVVDFEILDGEIFTFVEADGGPCIIKPKCRAGEVDEDHEGDEHDRAYLVDAVEQARADGVALVLLSVEHLPHRALHSQISAGVVVRRLRRERRRAQHGHEPSLR